MTHSSDERSGGIDERDYVRAMARLIVTIRILSAALVAVIARSALDGLTLGYDIVGAVLLAMLLGALWMRSVGRRVPASTTGDERSVRSQGPRMRARSTKMRSAQTCDYAGQDRLPTSGHPTGSNTAIALPSSKRPEEVGRR
jgi:hypothetical protein